MPKVSAEYEQAQRDKIIDGAAQSFAERGYRQTSIDEVARNLSISKGAIYIYFKSKEELFLAIYEKYLTQDHEALRSSLAADQPIGRQLGRVLDAFLSKLFEKDAVRSQLALQFWLESAYIPDLQALRQKGHQQDAEFLGGLLQAAQLTGEIQPETKIDQVTEVILATCDGLILNHVTGTSTLSREEVRQAVWNTFSDLLLCNLAT